MKAVYAALFKIKKDRRIEIGALGEIRFKPGIYVYVGSAMNAVEKRLERHFSEVDNLHWHIDYFSSEAEPVDFFILHETSEYECFLADAVSEIGEPIEGFGCSDCDCRAHLYRIPFQ